MPMRWFAHRVWAIPVVVTASSLVVEAYRDRCDWLSDAPSRRFVLYLSLVIPACLFFAIGQRWRALANPWALAAFVLLGCVPLVAGLHVHDVVEHQPLETGSVRLLPWIAARLPSYVVWFVVLGILLAALVAPFRACR